MLKNTAIALALTVGVTTFAAVDMVNLFIKADGFGPETKASTIAYNHNSGQNNVLLPNGVKMTVTEKTAPVKHNGQVIDATNYVDWQNIYRA